jgi:hypothetical protein
LYDEKYANSAEMQELDKTHFVYSTRKDKISQIKESQNDKNYLRAKQFENEDSIIKQQNVRRELEKLFKEEEDKAAQEEKDQLDKIRKTVPGWYEVEAKNIVNRMISDEMIKSELKKLVPRKDLLKYDIEAIEKSIETQKDTSVSDMVAVIACVVAIAVAIISFVCFWENEHFFLAIIFSIPIGFVVELVEVSVAETIKGKMVSESVGALQVQLSEKKSELKKVEYEIEKTKEEIVTSRKENQETKYDGADYIETIKLTPKELEQMELSLESKQ